MADEKILKDEILKDEQLDQVAGGTAKQTEAGLRVFWSPRPGAQA